MVARVSIILNEFANIPCTPVWLKLVTKLKTVASAKNSQVAKIGCIRAALIPIMYIVAYINIHDVIATWIMIVKTGIVLSIRIVYPTGWPNSSPSL